MAKAYQPMNLSKSLAGCTSAGTTTQMLVVVYGVWTNNNITSPCNFTKRLASKTILCYIHDFIIYKATTQHKSENKVNHQTTTKRPEQVNLQWTVWLSEAYKKWKRVRKLKFLHPVRFELETSLSFSPHNQLATSRSQTKHP